jgi:hypothetical protein
MLFFGSNVNTTQQLSTGVVEMWITCPQGCGYVDNIVDNLSTCQVKRFFISLLTFVREEVNLETRENEKMTTAQYNAKLVRSLKAQALESGKPEDMKMYKDMVKTLKNKKILRDMNKDFSILMGAM